MKHVFIVNPVSGKEDAGLSMVPKLRAAAEKLGLEYEVLPTKAPRHATQLAESCAAPGAPVRLYAVGGDGTLNEVFAGAWPYKNAEVASVPCGSGNDFVRNFAGAERFLDLPALMQGAAVAVDLMQVDGGVSAAITSAGLDADVAYNIPKYRRIPVLGGAMAYNISILEQLLRPLGKLLRINVDGRIMQGKYLIATVCNGQAYGGGFIAAPMAKLNDGVMDVVLVKKVSRLLIASVIGKYKKGLHIQNGKVIPQFSEVMQYFTAREVEITPMDGTPFVLNVDGECGKAPRLYAKAMPGAGRFVLPAGLSPAAAPGMQQGN